MASDPRSRTSPAPFEVCLKHTPKDVLDLQTTEGIRRRLSVDKTLQVRVDWVIGGASCHPRYIVLFLSGHRPTRGCRQEPGGKAR